MLDADADGRKLVGRFFRAEGKVWVYVSRPSGAGRDYEFYRHEACADFCGRVHEGAEEDQSATMAAFPYADPALLRREGPRHKVRITKSFYMGQYEVTLGQFMAFCREADYQIDAERDGKPMTGYGKNGELIESTAFRPWAPGWKVEPDHPVGYVSWNDAVAFCDWLSRKEGKKYRLPTEAEWRESRRSQICRSTSLEKVIWKYRPSDWAAWE